MTLLLSGSEDQLLSQLNAEGVEFEEFQDSAPVTGGLLPDKATLKRLEEAGRRELLHSEGSRAEFVKKAKSHWQRYNLQPYEDDELLLADQINVTTPLIRSRVDQAHGSLYGSLALTPFFAAQVDSGQADSITRHAEDAFEEQLSRAEFLNTFDNALRGSLVAGLGIMKAVAVPDDEDGNRVDVEPVDVRDLFMAPHNVRDLQQCTMIAQRYYETKGWLMDMAVDGIFDRAAVERVVPASGRDADDGSSTDRDMHGLRGDPLLSSDSSMVELLEVYIRVRPAEGKSSEMWRLIVARTGFVILEARRWDDGFPFWALRHQRGGNTTFCPSFADTLKDLQYGKDMLFSLAFEADRMSVAPFVEYDPLSPTADWILKREAEEDEEGPSRAIRILPGDAIPSRPGQQSLRFTYHAPANMAVSARMNDIESMAGVASIPVLPLTTYRSATEHRFSQANITARESQMLKVLRGDLTRFAEYVKRLWLKYVVEEVGEKVHFQHGTEGVEASMVQLEALRFEPKGMTTQADQMQVAAASGEAFQIALMLAAQKPVLIQTGAWPQVYAAARIRLESLGFTQYKEVLGDDPTRDERVKSLIPLTPEQQMKASMMLMQAQAGQAPMLQQGGGQPEGAAPTRESDAAPTVMPGGNPLMPGAEGEL